MRLCLAGADVTRSPSAAMFNAALRACDIEGAYENRSLQPFETDAFISALRRGEYRGCNVTMPYKRAFARACDDLQGDAATLGVVNTVAVEGRTLTGSNTDVRGFELALRAAGMWPDAPVCAVVLGAGGAAAAVCLALARARGVDLHLVARNADDASELAQRLRKHAAITPLRWNRTALQPVIGRAGLVVNATPAGLDALPFGVRELPLSCTVADVRYSPRPVDLASAAVQAGLRAQDGAEMLLQQAMLSFETWTGSAAPQDVMRTALQDALAT